MLLHRAVAAALRPQDPPAMHADAVKAGLLADLAVPLRESIVARARTRAMVAGEVVVRQGDPADELFVIRSGSCRVTLGDPALGLVREAGTLGPGDCFGDVSLLAESPHGATLTALETGELAVLSRADLAATPDAAAALCRALAQRLDRATQRDKDFRTLHVDDYPGAASLARLLPARVSRYCRAVTLDANAERALVGLVDPHDATARTFINDVLRGRRVEFAAIPLEEYTRFAAAEVQQDSQPAAEAMFQPAVSLLDESGTPQPLGEQRTGELLGGVFQRAVTLGASDLHVEPGEGGGRIRGRLDGHLVPLEEGIDPRLFDRLVSRLKVMAEVDIAERRRPQDGRFTLLIGDQRIEARLSTMPSIVGEKIVLRLLDHGQSRRRLHDLVLARPLADRLAEAFASPGGLVLVTGPTGSGKTTTLYAGLEETWLADPLVNIVTLEDPVEYRLPYAVQVQIDRTTDMSFAHVLRTVLRQDPDVILVGEMRDPESATIAVEAATTGHLVLSSLHTETAVDAISRLRRLEVPPFLTAATLRCVVSQRLVPKVCRGCARPAADSPLVERLLANGVLDAADRARLVEGAGCDSCQGRGEVGRVGVYEVLLVDPALRALIEAEATTAELLTRLTPDNFVSAARYARFLLVQGIVAPGHVADFLATQRGLGGGL